MSKIFEPYRSLGLYSSNVRSALKYCDAKECYNLYVPVGDRFNVYKTPNLAVTGISVPLNGNIECFCVSKKYVFCSSGNIIYVYKHHTSIIRELMIHNDKICLLVTVTANNEEFIVSYDDMGNIKISSCEEFDLMFEHSWDPETFAVSAICQPHGYTNKILLGSHQGPLQLWNYKHGKQLYWFKGYGEGVSIITQAPSDNVCAIGMKNGTIVLCNILYDKIVLKLSQDGGCITDMTFRTTDKNDLFLITGCDEGHVFSWAIKERQDLCYSNEKVYKLHMKSIVSLHCITCTSDTSKASCNALITQGSDNCLKLGFFDRPDGSLRVHINRSGHFLPPQSVKFWCGSSAGGTLLLSGGKDSQLKIFSVTNERYDKNIGLMYKENITKSMRKRGLDKDSIADYLLSPPIDMGMQAIRADYWDSIVVLHEKYRKVTSWNFVKTNKGKHNFLPDKFWDRSGEAFRKYKNTYATCIWMTNCGNMVLVGYSSGDVVKFNLQSGMDRGQFGEFTAHDIPIVGVCSNMVNSTAITVASMTEESPSLSEIKFWDFNKGSLLHELKISTKIVKTHFHMESELLGVALQNGDVILVDSVHRKIIRRLPGHSQMPVIDFTFSGDAKWIVVAHDNYPVVKTWDIIDGLLIDAFKVSEKLTSIALSPQNDYLATTHEGCRGVYIWTNTTLFRKANLSPLLVETDHEAPEGIPDAHMSTHRLISSIVERKCVGLPSNIVSIKVNTDVDLDSFSESADSKANEEITIFLDENKARTNLEQKFQKLKYESPEQVADCLTNSGLNSSHFNTLLQLEKVKERNRENAVPQQIKDSQNMAISTPFFLPVKETAKGIQALSEEEKRASWFTEEDDDDVRLAKRKRLGELVLASDHINDSFTHLRDLLRDMDNEKSHSVAKIIKYLSMNDLDLYIQTLVSEEDLLRLDPPEETSNDEQIVIPKHSEQLMGFLRWINHRVLQKLDVDLLSSCLLLVIRYHTEYMLKAHQSVKSQVPMEDFGIEMNSESPISLLNTVKESLRSTEACLEKDVNMTICLADFIRNPISMLKF